MFHPEAPGCAPSWCRIRPTCASTCSPGTAGAGHGRELISTFLASVAAAGAASCHLGVRPANVDARRFYARVGFRPIEVRGVEHRTYLVHQAR